MRKSESDAKFNELARRLTGVGVPQDNRLSVASGAGGSTEEDRDADAFSWPLDDKGQLATGADGTGAPIKVPAGTDGYILSANSATSTGLEWIANTGGVGTGKYRDLIYELDGVGGFSFITDDDGNPMYVLADLE